MPLTTAQVSLYGKLWGRVTAANGWYTTRGRLDPEATGPAASERHGEVWALAEEHARRASRSVAVEDLRRACTAAVAGRWISTKDLSNREFSRLLCLFRLLIDPLNLEALQEWGNPGVEERKRVVGLIRGLAPYAYIDAICSDRFKGYVKPFWEDLTLLQLRQLLITLRERAPVTKQENEPW